MKEIHKKVLLGYALLSVIKLFTARIDFQIEEGPIIIAKLYPTWTNIFHGSDRSMELYNQQYTWYRERLYVELIRTYNSIFVTFYDSLIFLWWAATIVLGVYYMTKLFMSLVQQHYIKRTK